VGDLECGGGREEGSASAKHKERRKMSQVW